MKKIFLVLLLSLFIFTGCGTNMNTPTAKVEEFLGKYQKMDDEVLDQLADILDEDSSMNDSQKKEYQSLLEKQYQNLSYKIKSEKIKDDTATVDVEIEVYDYATSIRKSREYFKDHRDEFEDTKETINEENPLDNDGNNTTDKEENNTDNDTTNDSEDNGLLDTLSEFIDYKIKQLKNVTEKVKYEITFNLTKEDKKWKIDDISDMDIEKIHGLYEE